MEIVENLSICKLAHILDISNTCCIPNLLKSMNATCHKINNQHAPTINEITSGILLLNQFSRVLENASQSLIGLICEIRKYHYLMGSS